ncbi:MAG: hypothetical protein IJQ91_06665 [Acidaminococcaceae bacterium]|nr:hypothetical protein [Acidaminococcaceae bacterium]
MTISKKLQKILAVTLMTSFLSTSFVMGVSEAAAARPSGGRPPAQSQQIRPETRKGPSGHQMKAPMQRQSSGHHARPAVHKSAPAQRMQSMHKGGPGHKAQPMMHKSGSIRHGGPVMHKGGPGHKAQPMMHKGGSIRHGGPVIHRSGPVIHRHHPAPPPRHHHHGGHRSMHSGDWIGALVVGGIIGAIIANNSHRTSHPDYVEYAE